MTSESQSPWRLEGRLAGEEVPGYYQASLRWMKRHGMPETIDLSGVEKTDSSALALLLEWMAWARARGRKLVYANPPEGLRVIAELSQVSALLGWSDTRK